MKKIFIIYILLFLFATISFSQIKNIGLPFINNYIPQSYGGGIQTWDAVQDHRGIMYFANNGGVMEYDGNNWRLIELPIESTTRSLAINEQGIIYVSSDNEFGYLTTDSVGNTIYASLIQLLPKEQRDVGIVWTIISFDNKMYFQSQEKIYVLDQNNKIEIIELENSITGFYVSKNGLFVFSSLGITVIDGENTTLIKNSETIKEIFVIVRYNAQTELIITTEGDLYKLKDNNIEKWDIENSYLKGTFTYNAFNIKDEYFVLTSLSHGAFIINKEGKLIQHFGKNKGLTDDAFYNAYLDNQNNLWLMGVTTISKIELFSPFTVFNRQFNLNIPTITFISKENENLYVGTGIKVLKIELKDYYPPQDFIKFDEIEGIEEQSWNTIKINNDVFVCVQSGIFQLLENEIKPIFHLHNPWKIVELEKNKSYIAGVSSGLYSLKYKDNAFTSIKKIEGFDENCRYIETDVKGDLWVSVSGKGLYKMKLNKAKDSIINKILYDEKKGLFDKSDLTLKKEEDILIISTKNLLYTYDEKTDSIIKIEKWTNFFEQDHNLAFIGIDKTQNVWIEDGEIAKIAVLIKQKNGEYTADFKIAARLKNFNLFSNFIALTENTVILATGKGLIHYDDRITKNYDIKFNNLIRKVEILRNDSLVFGGAYINADNTLTDLQTKKDIHKIKYKNNSIRISYSAVFYEESHKIEYQYLLPGFDKQWSKWSTEIKKEYTNIPPGKYTFKVKAKNIYQTESNIAEYQFIILPPWYRTIYAYIIYFIIGILFILLIIKFSTHQMAVQNTKLEERVKKRTIELQIKNVELEQQKEEIQTQTEELEIINKELEKLSIVASETNNAVIITDKNGDFAWVNDAFVKMFGYTLAELIKNISSNIISKNTDSNVKKIIKKCFDEKISVEYELKTKSKAGKILWVHTTLTPIFDEYGDIRMLVAIDSDITKIKNAEKKITRQNENIKGSIRYALKIQESILPTEDDLNCFTDSFILYRPKDIVSGDFYWFAKNCYKNNNIENNKDNKTEIVKYSFFAMVDCTGHGVPGAFMSLIGSRLLSEIINERKVHETSEILEQLDKGVKDVLNQSKTNSRDGMDMSLCRIKEISIDNKIKYEVCFSGAKLPIIYYSQKQKELIKTNYTRRTIGGRNKNLKKFEKLQIILEQGDIIYLYSDGFKDQNNKERKKIGSSKISRVLSENINEPLKIQKEQLEKLLDNWQDKEEQRDDITFIGLKL